MKLVQAFIKPFEVPQKTISIKFSSIFSRVRDCEFKRCKGLYTVFGFSLLCAFVGKYNHLKLAHLFILNLTEETHIRHAYIFEHTQAYIYTHTGTSNSSEGFRLSNFLCVWLFHGITKSSSADKI